MEGEVAFDDGQFLGVIGDGGELVGEGFLERQGLAVELLGLVGTRGPDEDG